MDSGCANRSCICKRNRGRPRWVAPLEMDSPFAGQIGNVDFSGGQNPDILDGQWRRVLGVNMSEPGGDANEADCPQCLAFPPNPCRNCTWDSQFLGPRPVYSGTIRLHCRVPNGGVLARSGTRFDSRTDRAEGRPRLELHASTRWLEQSTPKRKPPLRSIRIEALANGASCSNGATPLVRHSRS